MSSLPAPPKNKHIGTRFHVGSSSQSNQTLHPRGAAGTADLYTQFHGKNVLFFIEKSQNHNSVVYEANVDPTTGLLNSETPLLVYWILYAREPIVEEGLNLIERNTAYGKTVKKIISQGEKNSHGEIMKHDLFRVHLVALPKFEILLWQDPDTLQVYAQVEEDGVKAELLSVFVQVKTSWGMPQVEYLDVKVKNVETGEIITKRINP